MSLRWMLIRFVFQSLFCITSLVDVAANIEDNWTVQRQEGYAFSGVACDQTIEQTLNRLEFPHI